MQPIRFRIYDLRPAIVERVDSTSGPAIALGWLDFTGSMDDDGFIYVTDVGNRRRSLRRRQL